MKLKYTLAGLVLLVLIGAIVWLLGRQSAPLSVSVSPTELGYLERAEEYRYQSETGEIIVVKYADELAQIVGGPHDQVILRQVVAASGVKYEGEQGLTLWTKGDEVRIETPQALAFIGTEVTSEVVPDIPPIVTDIVEPTATSTESEDVLVGQAWMWESATVDGETLTPRKAGVFSVTFSADGQLSGKTDCNGFGGSYTKTDSEITLGEFMSTLMFCEGSQESEFSGLFVSPLTVVANTNDKLTLRNADGATIELVRAQ